MSRRILAAALCAVRVFLIPVAALLASCVAVPATAQEGRASWYGPGFHARTTASGQRFDQGAATCAHRRLPFGALVRITNLANGKIAHCRVNDRGPFVVGRILDVSKRVAAQLGMIGAGTAPVRITVIK